MAAMRLYFDAVTPPSDDKRWKIVAATMRKLGKAFGYLEKPGLTFVAATLRLPLSRVYGVATFYQHFTMKPQGRHSCVVCTGTACHIKGAGALLNSISAAYRVKPGETTPDGELSVLTARCFGACGLAPVAVIDGAVAVRLTAQGLEERLSEMACHVA